MTDPVAPEHAPDDQWMARWGFLVATIWLLFLLFPLLAVWSDGSLGRPAKIGYTGLLVAFAAVYTDGTWATIRREREREREAAAAGGPDLVGWPDPLPSDVAHFAALLALTVAAYPLAGVAALGTVSFIVTFAVFHFRWPTVWTVFALGLASTVVLPLWTHSLADVWYLILIVGAVGAGTVVIRATETHSLERAHLRTRLVLSDERARVARDVHDVLGHSLTAVILKTELCQRLLAGVEPPGERDRAAVDRARVELDELALVSRRALAEIRATVVELRAAHLADEVRAARAVLADAGVDLVVNGDPSAVPEPYRPLAGWVLREAVTNIVRHARAGHCHLHLGPPAAGGGGRSGAAGGPPGAGIAVLRVGDDGVGFDGSREGNGLRGLRERAEAADATLLLGPGPDSGTELILLVPLLTPAPATPTPASGVVRP